jgi:hypothetical protein
MIPFSMWNGNDHSNSPSEARFGDETDTGLCKLVRADLDRS